MGHQAVAAMSMESASIAAENMINQRPGQCLPHTKVIAEIEDVSIVQEQLRQLSASAKDVIIMMRKAIARPQSVSVIPRLAMWSADAFETENSMSRRKAFTTHRVGPSPRHRK